MQDITFVYFTVSYKCYYHLFSSVIVECRYFIVSFTMEQVNIVEFHEIVFCDNHIIIVEFREGTAQL